MLLFKLLLTPFLMGAATLVARRWGPVVGGIFTALPLTAAPVSLFLYLEQGGKFAVSAACASMLGYAALGFFILVFVYVPRKWGGWLPPFLLSSLTYFAFAWLFSFLPKLGLLCFGVALMCLLLVLRLIPRGASGWTKPKVPWWDLPVRMAAAGGLVLGITGLASIIGPQWSGFLSTYPVFITLMGLFALLQAGQATMCMLMRGFVEGMFGALIFFFILQWALPLFHPALAYGLAALINMLVCGVDLWLSSHSLRALQRHLRRRKHQSAQKHRRIHHKDS